MISPLSKKILVDTTFLALFFATTFVVVEFIVPGVLSARIPASIVTVIPLIILLIAYSGAQIDTSSQEAPLRNRFISISLQSLFVLLFTGLTFFITRSAPLFLQISLTLIALVTSSYAWQIYTKERS